MARSARNKRYWYERRQRRSSHSEVNLVLSQDFSGAYYSLDHLTVTGTDVLRETIDDSGHGIKPTDANFSVSGGAFTYRAGADILDVAGTFQFVNLGIFEVGLGGGAGAAFDLQALSSPTFHYGSYDIVSASVVAIAGGFRIEVVGTTKPDSAKVAPYIQLQSDISTSTYAGSVDNGFRLENFSLVLEG